MQPGGIFLHLCRTLHEYLGGGLSGARAQSVVASYREEIVNQSVMDS